MKTILKQAAVVGTMVGALVFGLGCDEPKLNIQTGELPTVVEVGTTLENANNFMAFHSSQRVEQARQMRIASRGDSVYFRLSESERRVAECIVQGEAGGEDFDGKCLVAQCLVNACVESNIQPSQARKQLKYAGWKENVSDETKRAVREVFDNGYQVVTEPILYFYAPKLCTSKWHETQNFVIEHGCHRFFARK